MKRNQSIQERFVAMRAQGLSFQKIAVELGVSKQTLIHWSKDLRLQIQNCKVIEQEAFLEQLSVCKSQRVKTLASLLNRASEELSNRDFSAVPTEKLVGIVKALSAELSGEVGPTAFVGVKESIDLGMLNEVEEKWDV